MNLKLKFSIMMFLASLTIFSVGFASWSIASNTTTSNTSGTFLVDDVMNSNEYITTYAEIFEYYNDCFVVVTKNDDGEILDVSTSNVGYITIHISINLTKYKEIYSNSDYVLIDTTLKYYESSSVALLSSAFVTNMYINSIGNEATSKIYSLNAVTSTYQIFDVLETTEPTLELDFIFEFTVNDNSFFKELMDGNIHLLYNVKMVQQEGDKNE